MSKDRLLPEWFCTVHTKCRTPYISSIFVGIFVAIFASVIPIAILGELVSIGTLLAFVIVCAGVWMLRRSDPNLPRPFKTPMVPFVPIMGALISLLMMAGLPGDTWLRLIIWLLIGMALACVLLAGTAGFHFIEGWSWFDGFYMVVTTLTTIGYQEIHPLSHAGRVFNVFVIVAGVSLVFLGIGALTQALLEFELRNF